MSWIFQAVALVTTLISSLSQDLTNGLSSYGTLECQQLPFYLGSTPSPWGKSDPASSDVPDTGAVRSYTFSISRATKAPDGYQKSVILINGQFPGPLIEANWGDTIEVTVYNDIKDTAEGVTLHWHGQPQRLSPGEDGVPGVSQCPIPPGSSLTYRFRAEYFGTGWYHSHMSGQYTDGLYGPMVIYGPTQVPYDIDLGPIMLSDYSHTSYYDILKSAYLFPPVFPTIDNNLINGKGIFECSLANETICTPWAGLSKFAFQAGKVHRLRLINTGGEGSQKFSIDGHVLKVIANDYVSVEPYETDVVTLGIGQRTDVLVTASGAANGAYWMRSDIDEDCLNLTSVNSHALAAVYYPHSSTNAVPNTTATTWSSNNCQNDPLNQTIPYYPTTPPSQPATTAYVNITVGQNATGEFIFFINGTSFEVDYNAPLLPIAQSGNISQVPTARNLYDFGTNTSVRIVLENFWPTVHPIHLHGHNFWVLASGFGSWDGTVVNSDNPQRRDTHLMMPSAPDGTPSYLVIEFNTDNPGVWPMHCHTSIHASAGLLFNVLERSDLLQSQASPSSMQDNCVAWAAWTSKDFVDQIDSGL